MAGRDPNERERVSSPLELLFDLSFAVAFGVAGEQFSHLVAQGRIGSAVTGFVFAMFAVCWAWINFAWFASAFDTDDWYYRLLTMFQMVGVIVLTLGLPAMFGSIGLHVRVDNSIMVAGYVVMRVSMVLQWVRASRSAPTYRSSARMYVATILIAQLGWVGVLLLRPTWLGFCLYAPVLGLIELAGPVIAERRKAGTPWHAHHIAERYGLLAIIALGEGVIGTVATVSAAGAGETWTLDAVLLVVAGVALTFGMWWIYFAIDFGGLLHRHKERSFGWGYAHIVVFAAVAAVGAGLQVAAHSFAHDAQIGPVGVLLAIAIPVGVYVAGLFALFTMLARSTDPLHLWLIIGSALVLVLAVVLAAVGIPIAWCLLVVAMTPLVTVVGYETLGLRHTQRLYAE